MRLCRITFKLAGWFALAASQSDLWCGPRAGISIYTWLALIVYKANEVVRRECGRKGERSAPGLIALAATVGSHIPLILLMLRHQRLWLNFLLLAPANVPTVGWLACTRLCHVHPAQPQIVTRLLRSSVGQTGSLNMQLLGGAGDGSPVEHRDCRLPCTDGRHRHQGMWSCMCSCVRHSCSSTLSSKPTISVWTRQVGVLILHPCSQRSDQWRRSGVLTVVEAALLLYRALLSTPVWFKFFEEQNIGSILCSSCTGAHDPCLQHFLCCSLCASCRAESATPLCSRKPSFTA